MSAKKKEVKPISTPLAIVLVLIAFAVMGMFLVYMFSSGGGNTSDVNSSLEQDFGTESSFEPLPEDVVVKETMADANVGDAVVFGKYEQNNDSSDGKEALEWIVLEKQEGKILLISRYCIDTMPYNTERVDVTWDKSSLRDYLNGDFIESAFDDNEKSSLITENNDKVSLLSVADAKKYYEYDSWRASTATEYAVSKGARVENGCCWWWLLDKGTSDNFASYVHFDGTVRENGFAVDYDLVAVRPIIWVSADAENETSTDSSSEISE